jgi:hypothetical protein
MTAGAEQLVGQTDILVERRGIALPQCHLRPGLVQLSEGDALELALCLGDRILQTRCSALHLVELRFGQRQRPLQTEQRRRRQR